jgi:hypothetical protein
MVAHFSDKSLTIPKTTVLGVAQQIAEKCKRITKSQYQTSYILREEMKSQIEKMLDKGVISESN